MRAAFAVLMRAAVFPAAAVFAAATTVARAHAMHVVMALAGRPPMHGAAADPAHEQGRRDHDQPQIPVQESHRVLTSD